MRADLLHLIAIVSLVAGAATALWLWWATPFAMLGRLAPSLPVNAWLIRRGWKEAR